jgi:predicted Zn-ribbon and HTH transcriptional regulator
MFDEALRGPPGRNEIMVTIATFNEPSQAKHLKSRLEQAGVKADVHNEGHLQKVAFMSKPQANAKVLVTEEDFEKANKLMLEWEASDPEIGSAIRCPQCKSPRIEYPQLTRKFLTPSIASVLFALRIFQKEFYCQDCHFTWSPGDDK